jgi:hypothetical protein
VPRHSNRTIARGRWALPVAALFVCVWAVAAAPVWAQKVVPTTPLIATPVPTIPLPPRDGGPRLVPAQPDFVPAPALVSPLPAVVPAAPGTAAPTGAPAPLIRFRCAVSPGESACREPPPSDAGDSDAECNCVRDFCYQDGTGTRVCEKAAD